MEKTTVKISVRNLVEFILRSGDLDSRRGSTPDKEAMQLGSRLHRKIQKQMDAFYQPEVMLRRRFEYAQFFLVVEGRADGIINRSGDVTIDEIKGTYADLEQLTQPLSIHLAQAKCYAYIYGTEQGCEQITVQLTYCNMESEEIKRFQQTETMAAVTDWFHELLDKYYQWAQFQHEWHGIRTESMQGLEFPFPYRPGQKEIVAGVYAAIARKKELFIQAPTGIGKTMSAVFPAVRAVGEGLGDKIFYLTAKTITRTVAEEAFSLLRMKGLQYKVITLTAKEKLCICDEVECHPGSCPRAKGHFDRINDAVFELIASGSTFDRETLERHSEKWQVCPYEMSLDTALWCDAIICDYNYVFDPRAHLRRFFGDNVKGEYLFLIDEAHNLVERGREMFSAVLYKEDILAVKRIIRPYSSMLERLLEKSNRQMLEYKRACDSYRILTDIEPFVAGLLHLIGEIEYLLEELDDGEVHQALLEFYFKIASFLNIIELLDDNYIIYSRHDDDGKFCVRLFCVNPARNLQNCLDKGSSAVFFSATLVPLQYYKTLFTTRDDSFAINAASPFPPDHKALVLGKDVSSRYARRGYHEYRRIAEYIDKVIRIKTGNYLIFFPSYQFMEAVYEIYQQEYATANSPCLKQSPLMNEREREDFLASFQKTGAASLVGFCIMGGIFAEGIDLIGSRLIGAVVVGTGLPQISYEREILMNFYNERGANGFDYAYRFPGMNKVLQAAGRVIRTAQDRGVIILLDERFLGREYRQLFPTEWTGYQVCSLDNIVDKLSLFWANN